VRTIAARGPAVALLLALPAALLAGPDADTRVLTVDLDGDPDLETVAVRPVDPAGYAQQRVVIGDPTTGAKASLGRALDRIGRLAARDFARTGHPQVFTDGSSGASGHFYAAALGRWDGTALRTLWRYDTGTARSPRGFAVGSAQARIAGRLIHLRETLVPPNDPTCCPGVIRMRISAYRYRPSADRYLLERRVTGPPRRLR
jgi:hypothetical protein